MQINQLANLVLIRNYVHQMSVSATISRDSLKQMSTTLIVLDQLLLKELSSTDFKEVISFTEKGAKEAVTDFVKRNNIKSGMKTDEKLTDMHQAITNK